MLLCSGASIREPLLTDKLYGSVRRGNPEKQVACSRAGSAGENASFGNQHDEVERKSDVDGMP